MRMLTGLFVLMLAIAACSGSTAETTTSPVVTATTSSGAATTTAFGSPDPTSSPTTDFTTTPPGVGSDAKFVITQVGLGVLGQVVIMNVGNEPGSLAGHWLCQRPSYYEFPDVELQPGQSAAVGVTGRDDIFDPPPDAIAIDGIAGIGPFNSASGEVGLYVSRSFSDPNSIISYVEWGSSGHGRSGTAVTAQIWPEGGFVETTESTGAILATLIPPTDPEHWTSGG